MSRLASDEPVGFEQHIATQADAILDRLEAGTMPCDGAWPAERVAIFRHWVDAGTPA